MLRAGPRAPDSLAKRAVTEVDDQEMRKIAQTDEDRAARSHADEALTAIHKALGTESLRNILLKAASDKAARAGSRPVSFSRGEMARILESARRLRKDARSGIGLQSENATDDPPSPSLYGAVDPRDVTDEGAPGQRADQFGSRHASSMRPDSPDASDSGDATVKWLKRAHRQPPRKGL
jgi:hypothetical protein